MLKLQHKAEWPWPQRREVNFSILQKQRIPPSPLFSNLHPGLYHERTEESHLQMSYRINTMSCIWIG
ncbi:hypothetical protein OJAV_G00109980 [Oryzias javanicus]|uniref:Uncharacterized protein n=1 Tax=Oryzias javanicus TaxID=123683 RepID=A0A437CW63_ORYJA|nr:hypothetical protein OJAV_G00109980 [Oryzias javanicus]